MLLTCCYFNSKIEPMQRLSLFIGFLVVSLFCFEHCSGISYCPPEWKEYNYACFYFNPTPLSWSDADAACSAMVPGARLAAPRDGGEGPWMATLRTVYATQTPWIGARFEPSMNGYVGVTKAALPWVPFCCGNNININGYCAQIRPGTYDWKSDNCTVRNPSICMFYTQVTQMSVESFSSLNRLHGGVDWFSQRGWWWALENGQPYNVSLTTGPVGTPDSAMLLNTSTSSYIAFINATNPGSNFKGYNFYFSFYLYMTASAGPILQYRYNQTHYGFNIWQFANGSMLLDFVQWTPSGPIPGPQVYVPETCSPLNQWNFITVNYWLGNNGLVMVRSNTTGIPCVQINIGPVNVEMSGGFDIGRRQRPLPSPIPPQWPTSPTAPPPVYTGDIFWTGSIACLISGDQVPNAYWHGELMLWCTQALLEQSVDRTMAKRMGIVYPKEDYLVGIWPLNDFYRSREAAGRIFYGNIYSADMIYGYGPNLEINGSFVFDGQSSFLNISGKPNQAVLAASMNFLRKSFSISAWVHIRTTADGGPIASFQSDESPKNPAYQSTMITLVQGSHINVLIPNLGGFSLAANMTFSSVVTPGGWSYLTITFDYFNGGQVSVFVDGVQRGATQTVGLVDIEAHTNIYIGRTAYGPPAYFKGKMSCFSVHSTVLTTADMQAMKPACSATLKSGVTRDQMLFKPQHLRFFLPLGRNYQLRDLSGKNVHGTTKGHLGLTTGPLGHPYSATRFYHEPNSAIDIQQNMLYENPYMTCTNDSVTYMGYVYSYPNRDGNLPWDRQMFMQHWDPTSGRGSFFGMNGMNYQMYFELRHKDRTVYWGWPRIDTLKLNLLKWNWFVVRYSKLTRRFTMQLDGVEVHDQEFGWPLVNLYSSLKVGSLNEDQWRWTGKMSCLMAYDTDLRDDEILEAKDMCHRHLIRAYGQPADLAKCYHSSQGWEYKGKVSWTASNRLCKPWTNQTTYMDPNAFPEMNIAAAGSYCRNPELTTDNTNPNYRVKPWCYTNDPAVPWEYCNIPSCNLISTPFHNAEQIIGAWPMGKTYGGMDISGHDSHARVGDIQWATGPFSGSNTATYFKPTTLGSYLVQHTGYSNLYDFLDLSYKGAYCRGYSYSIYAYFSGTYSGTGAIWSWESSSGEGGQQGLLFRYSGTSMIVNSNDKYLWSGRQLQCDNLVAGKWYHFTFVYNRDKQQLELYRDTTVCSIQAYDSFWHTLGLYTYSGSFKFGNQQVNNIGSAISLACAFIHLYPLTVNDIAVVTQKCADLQAGKYNDYIFGGLKPMALWPMSGMTEGMNTRGLNHALYSMTSPTTNALGVKQGAFAFPGNNNQYFWAAQDYIRNLDVCQMSHSFSMSTYVYVQAVGTAFSFHTVVSNIDDNNNYIGRGNQISLMNTQNDFYFTMNDGGSAPIIIKPSVLGSNTWVHLTVTYDYRGDNFYMFVNGTQVYQQVGLRGIYCQTSGSISLGRVAFRPTTLPNAANALQGALSCAQIYSSGLLTETAVKYTMRYCSHPDYIGCFPAHDSGSSDFIANAGFWKSENLTVSQCRIACGNSGYRFAALRNGDSCLCGNTYGRDGPDAQEGCGIQCPGNKQEWCGGPRHFSVYNSIARRIAVAPKIRSVDYLSCPPLWYARGTNCFRVFTNRLNFTQAVASCAYYGATLATITENEENYFYQSIIPPLTLQSGDHICLGANNTVAGVNKASNMDGKAFFYSNFGNTPALGNAWVCMLSSTRFWYEKTPNTQLNYVCKKPTIPFTDGLTTPACAAGWVRYGDSCYLFQMSQLPYRFAQATCRGYSPQTNLVKITSYTQFKVIQNLTDWQHPFWIGLEYLPAVGDFVWAIDNSTLAGKYNEWAGDEISELTFRRCVFADSRTQYGWRAADCEGALRQSFVCQYDLPTANGIGPIGFSSGRVANWQLSATNSTSINFDGNKARVGFDWAWCADPASIPGSALLVELIDSYQLTEMWVQGNPQANEWTTTATLDYSNDRGITWTTFTYTAQSQYFNGISWVPISTSASNILPMAADSNTLVKVSFGGSGIQATNLRIMPTAFNIKPCMRLEFVGSLLSGANNRTLLYPFKPIRFELSRLAGSSVRYTVTPYIDDPRKPTRMTQAGPSDTILGLEYAYYPRYVGRQKVVFTGTDAEGIVHELYYEMKSATRARALVLNMCPPAIEYDYYAPCEFRIIGGSELAVTTDYGFEVQGPRRLVSSRVEIGSITPPSATSAADNQGYVYLMLNQVVRANATVYAIEAIVQNPGWITIQIFKPSCASLPGTYFCPKCHCCLYFNTTCATRRAFDVYKCSPALKDPWENCSMLNSDSFSRNGYFTGNNLAVDYMWVTEWRKYFMATGQQVVYLNESETYEVTLGMIMALHRNSTDDGLVKVYSSPYIAEYNFPESSIPNFAARFITKNAIIQKLGATMVSPGIMHMVRLLGMSSVGVGFGRRWRNVVDGKKTVQITVQDINYPDAVLMLTHDIQVQYRCINYRLAYSPIANATTNIPFFLPPHNGTDCQYSIDFGDGTPVVYRDYTNRNETFYHIYKLDGVYNITITSWNLVFSSSSWSTITVVFPMQKMSIYLANQPATEISTYSSAIVTFSQVSSGIIDVVLDANGTSLTPVGSLRRNFTTCLSGWTSGVSSKTIIDACYRFFPYVTPLTFNQAQTYCASLGATLATVNSDAELEFLLDVINAGSGSADNGAWVGYSQLRDGFKFWVSEEDKTALPAPAWHETSAPYPTATGGKCAYFDYTSRRLMNDDCNAVRPMICKRETAISKFCGQSPGWQYDPTSNRCFKAFGGQSIYSTAATSCRAAAAGGRLAIAESQTTFNILKNLIAITDPNINYYIGMWRPNGTWMYFDGWQEFQPNFTSYDSGQPVSTVGQNCMVMQGTNGLMRSSACSYMGGFICEKPIYGKKPNRYFVRTASRRYIVPKPQTPTCQAGWTISPTTSTCYRLITATQKTWANAESYCLTQYGAHLATLQTVADQTIFWNQFASTANVGIWIGYAQLTSSAWLWSDGSNTTGVSTRWDPIGQPSTVTGGYAYYPTTTNYWRSGVGTEVMAFACSKPAVKDWKVWAGSCPTGYIEYSGRCFSYIATTLNFSAADIQCKNAGGGLASIQSDEDLAFIRGLLPFATDYAWLGMNWISTRWDWQPDVRGVSPVYNYTSMWASTPPATGGTTACTILARPSSFKLTPKSCTAFYGYICEQPAAYCPPSWTVWAGSCYRSFPQNLQIQPDSIYDTASAACQYEDSLPVSPATTEEKTLAVNLAGAGKTFPFGYRRLVNSKGFIDYWGRRSYFTGVYSEPGLGTASSAIFNGGTSSISFATSMASTATVCQMPTKLTADVCVRECLATSEFNCQTVYYNGKACHFTAAYAPDDWFGLRDSNSQGDLYTVRKDLCPLDLITEAQAISSSQATPVTVSDVQLIVAGSSGFVPASASDILLIDFANSVWINSFIMGKRASGSTDYVKTFTVSFTFDRDQWYNYQDPPGNVYEFTANDVDTDVVSIKLPNPLMAKSIKIVPSNYSVNPSFRLQVVGCAASIFMDYADYRYVQSGTYTVLTSATSPQSNSSVPTLIIPVQSRLSSLEFTNVAPLPYGNPAKITFAYKESAYYSFPVANGTFNGWALENATITTNKQIGSALVQTAFYSGVGVFPLNLTLDNLISDPLTIVTSMAVDFAVANLSVTTNATNLHGALRNQSVMVYVTMANCTRCNISIDYGAPDAIPNSYFVSMSFIPEYVPLAIPSVIYPTVGTAGKPFVITVRANNYLPYQMTATYEIYIQRPPVPTAYNFTSTQANKVTSRGPAYVGFSILYTGYVSEWPTTPYMFLDYQDGINFTAPFGKYLLPPPSAGYPDPSVTRYLMGDPSHPYYAAGTFTVPITVYNRVGSVSGNVTFMVDEDIEDLKLVPLNRYITPGDYVTFNISKLIGSRFNWQVKIPYGNNSTDYGGVYNDTFKQFTWQFKNPGFYWPSINASSPVQPSYPETPLEKCCPIVVQYPVLPTKYRLTASPDVGRLTFENIDDDVGKATVVYKIWVKPGITEPSSPFLIMDYGDMKDGVNMSLTCQPPLGLTTDGPWILCLNIPYFYNNVSTFNAKAKISNMVSSVTLTTQFTCYVAITNLRMEVRWTDNETHPHLQPNNKWYLGFPRIDQNGGKKFYSQQFFPAGKPLRIVANAKMGDGLRYCFNSSATGNLTDCSNVPVTQKTPNFVFVTIPYDTPCGARLEDCGQTVTVTAANAIDMKSVTINLYIQKPSKGARVVALSPAIENSTHELQLLVDQMPTDACIEVDYGTGLMTESGRIRLYGSEYTCAELYSQDIMASLRPFSRSEIAARILNIGGKYIRRGAYIATVKVRNFVDFVNSSNSNDMQASVIITKGPCSMPLLMIETNKTKHFKKDEFNLPAFVKMNCSASTLMSVNHTMFYKSPGSTTWTDVTLTYFTVSKVRLMMQGSAQNPIKQDINLFIESKKLPYGWYRFNISAMMVEEIGINTTISYQVEVVESDLVTGLTPSGSWRDYVYGQTINLTAYDLSYDPDEVDPVKAKEGIKVYYFCKRDCEGSWPDFTNVSQVDDFISDPSAFRAKYSFYWDQCQTNGDKNLKSIGYDRNGCFFNNYHTDFPSLNQENLTKTIYNDPACTNASSCEIVLSRVVSRWLKINSKFQFENQTYNLLAIVRKGAKRFSLLRQSYRLERGEAPQAVVTPVTNCVYKQKDTVLLNPTSRASFRGLIVERTPGVPYIFEWTLIRIPDKLTTAFAMDNLKLMRENYSWPMEYWINGTSTGAWSDDLSINAHFFNNETHFFRNYIAYVEVARGNNPRRGISSIIVTINKPPQVDNVTCTSNQAVGHTGTLFKFACNGFKSHRGDLSRYVFSVRSCSSCPVVVLSPTLGIPSYTGGVKLPAGVANENFVVTVYIDAFDDVDSIGRVKFTVIVTPQVDLGIIQSMAKVYMSSSDIMVPQDLCQQMFTFSSLMNYFQLDPVYSPNVSAYVRMDKDKKDEEDKKVLEDQSRYNEQLNYLIAVRDNQTSWILDALTKKSLQKDPQQIRTCCSAMTSILESPNQAKGKIALENAIQILKILTSNLTSLATSPTRDADLFDLACASCVGIIGKMAEALKSNLQTVRKGPPDTVDGPASTAEIKLFEKRFGTLDVSIRRSLLQDELADQLYTVVKGAKVLREASSALVAPGMTSNIRKIFIMDMNNTVIPSGSADDCGSFRLGNAAKMFATADTQAKSGNVTSGDSYSDLDRLLSLQITVKSASQDGNCLAFDESADDLNSQVQSLVFVNSTGQEIIIKDLPFYIDITVESKNNVKPEDVQLTSLTAAYPRPMKTSVMNVGALSAMFIIVDRWTPPTMCNNSHLIPGDIAQNASCYDNKTTTITYENVNYTVGSLNLTDEEVIFFIYIKANNTPTEIDYQLSCTLPRMTFEDDMEYARLNPNIETTTAKPSTTTSGHGNSGSNNGNSGSNNGNSGSSNGNRGNSQTTTTSTTTTKQSTPTTTTHPPPACSTLKYLNQTCCNGTVNLSTSQCNGYYVIPTTPAPLLTSSSSAKNCTRPTEPSRSMCFFDNRIVNVTERYQTFRIGVRAIPRALVRAYLQKLYGNSSTSKNISKEEAFKKASKDLMNMAVRVGFVQQTYTASCQYFNKATLSWSSEGCYVGELSTPNGNPSLTQCFCNHLTSFSSNFDVPMNTFDPRDSAFTHLDQNPICFTFGICIICCFFALLIWARKRDKEDEKKWGTIPLADNDPRDKYAYEITIWTGQRANSGTSARVSFVLLGDECETPPHLLEADERDILQRSGIDSFLLLTPRSLGKLVQLRIWHDNSGSHPDWYFSRMQVQDLQRNRQHYFLCDRWLAIDEDDGMVERTVPVAGRKELAGFEHIFYTKSRRKLTDGHIWVSVFSRPPLSKFTRCQRLTCCLSVLYCTMLANIMFYGQSRDPPGSTRVDFGPFSMSLTKIFISIVSTLIVMPMNVLIVQLFRMSKHRPTKQEQKMEELRSKAMRIQEEERKKKLAAGHAAPPEQVGLTTVSRDVDAVHAEQGSMKKRSKKADKAKKQKKPFKLPWWCVIVAYCLAAATCGVAFWAIVEFGGALGPDRAQEWLVSMIISLVTDILLIQPLKIFAIVLFYALIIKSPTKDEDIQEKAALKDDEVFLHHVPTEAEMIERQKNRENDKRDYVFLPPDPEELRQAREVRLKEQKMFKILKEIGFYLMFLYLLMMVAFGTQDDWSFQLQKQMRRVYQSAVLATPSYNTSNPADIAAYNPRFDGHDEVFDNMWQESQFFTYMERTLVPSVLDGSWYQGSYKPNFDVFTKDQQLFLVGTLRIRQLRISNNACRIPKNMRTVYTNKCLAPYSLLDEETRNFTAGWKLAPTSNNTFDKNGNPITMGDPRGFAYVSPFQDRGLPFQAALATYNGGGYVVDLGRKLNSALAKVAWLRNSKWIDDQTRAIFIEFNLYCPGRNLFAISQTVVEFFEGGSIILYPYFYVTKIDAYYGMFALILLAFQLITLALVIYLFVREVRLAVKHKRQYWMDWWAVTEFVHLLSCIVMAILFVVRYAMARFIVGDNYKKTHKDSYTNFNLFINYDQLVQCFMGFVLFLSFIKMIRLLRFNRRLVIMISTLRHVRGMMLSFFVVFFVVYLAFAQLGYLAFGQKLSGYASFVNALESLFSMILGVYDYQGISGANPYIGPVFFTCFSVFVNIFLVNSFVAILMVAYEEVRADDAKIGNEHEMLAFIMDKFKKFLGLAPKKPTSLSVDKRFAYLDAAVHEDEIDKFTSRMDQLMTKLDQHLEKTKSQFSGMFDQRFLQRRQREIYVTD